MFNETHRNPGTSAILSFIAPGLGQIYNGRFLWGIFWLIITPGFWITSALFFGWPFHIISAWQAHKQAKLHNTALTSYYSL